MRESAQMPAIMMRMRKALRTGKTATLGSLLGPEFIAAKDVLTLMLLAATLDLATSPLLSGLYAMGHAIKTLRITMVSTALYLVMFVLLTHQFGLIGAGLATSAGAALTLAGMILLMRSNKRPA